jgi:hypothetical protein
MLVAKQKAIHRELIFTGVNSNLPLLNAKTEPLVEHLYASSLLCREAISLGFLQVEFD